MHMANDKQQDVHVCTLLSYPGPARGRGERAWYTLCAFFSGKKWGIWIPPYTLHLSSIEMLIMQSTRNSKVTMGMYMVCTCTSYKQEPQYWVKSLFLMPERLCGAYLQTERGSSMADRFDIIHPPQTLNRTRRVRTLCYGPLTFSTRLARVQSTNSSRSRSLIPRPHHAREERWWGLETTSFSSIIHRKLLTHLASVRLVPCALRHCCKLSNPTTVENFEF